ncbi:MULTISPECIES: CPBP family intramembrane glutamic endopeptidase [unclassified Streptococcus]|uniref:CPBP family intramembrane glutamic endopeptidase n=1 Tax=unclassified Streptococcus TaxID=2608887 RepID=UPI001914A568|nr:MULTISPECIES: type II CAAX endopeptidase family protein [unclassified Streptococcus]MBK5080610.1 CPBP family intramembrane metalloprotease [Streptococcus sp. 10.1]MBK5159792.1 CPBP family intramembrane metalloprotease [Streptococcus sp. 9.1]
MKKRMLEKYTSRYDKVPSWLMIMLSCFIAFGYVLIGGFLAGIAVGIPLFIVFAFLMLNGNIQLQDVNTISFNLFSTLYFQLGVFVFIALVIFFWVKVVEKRPIRTLGFFKGHIWLNLLKGWGLGTLLLLVSFFGTYLLGGLEFLKVDFSQRTLLYILSLIPFWFIQGGTEELVTRGWLLQTVTNKLNLSWGIAISSSFFSILHLGNQGVTALSLISIVLVGVLTALYMLKTDNIWGVAALHGAWNFAQGNLVGVSVSGQNAGGSLLHFQARSGVPDWLSGGAFGLEGNIVTCLVLLVGIVILRLQLKKENF